MPMVTTTELARSKEKDPTLTEDIRECVKQHAGAEAIHHELEAAHQEHIVRVVVRKYKLFARTQVINKFGKTPRSLNLPEIRLHESPGGGSEGLLRGAVGQRQAAHAQGGARKQRRHQKTAHQGWREPLPGAAGPHHAARRWRESFKRRGPQLGEVPVHVERSPTSRG